MRQIGPYIAAALLVSAVALSAAAERTGPSSDGPPLDRATPRSSSMTQQNTGEAGGKPRPPSASTNEYRDATTQLLSDLGIRYSNDADKDFAALIAAYSKGAAAVARIELQHGKDPEMRRLAEHVIAANENDAARIKAWLAKKP